MKSHISRLRARTCGDGPVAKAVEIWLGSGGLKLRAKSLFSFRVLRPFQVKQLCQDLNFSEQFVIRNDFNVIESSAKQLE